MQKLLIHEGMFLDAFARDVDYHDAYPQEAYLDRGTGDIAWVYDCERGVDEAGTTPEENERMREVIAATPDQYLRLPGRTHGQHHDILQAFIDSNWTPDEEARRNSRNAYIGSIGAWLRRVEDSAREAYYLYRDQKISESAEDFLRSQGIEPVWR
jgi:hypothetical protein